MSATLGSLMVEAAREMTAKPEAVSTPRVLATIDWARRLLDNDRTAMIEYKLGLVRADVAELIAERDALVKALDMAVTQNEHDMVLTGEECRACRSILAMCGGAK